MTEIIITADLNQNDWLALQTAARARLHPSARQHLWPALGGFCLALAWALISHWLGAPFSLSSFLGGMLVIGLMLWHAQRQSQASYSPHQNGLFLGNCTFILNNEGVESRRERSGTRVGWRHVLDVSATDTHVFVWLDTLTAFCIPARYLPMHVVDLMAHVEQWRHHSDDTRPRGMHAPHTTLVPLVTPGSPWRTLRYWWQWRAAPQPTLSFNPGPTVTLAAIAIGLYWLGDWLRADANAVFYAYNLPVLAVHALFVLALSFWFMLTIVPRPPFAHLVFVLTGVLPVLALAWVALYRLQDPRWWLACMLLLSVYALGYLLRALRQLAGRIPWPALGGGLAASVVYALLMAGSEWELHFWYPPETQDSEVSDTSASTGDSLAHSEALLFAQQTKLDAALSKVQSASGATPQVFFVGFAGVAEQKVFAEEIFLASKVISARYHLGSQQLHLINDRRDTSTHPIASVSSLHYALNGVASKMRRDTDVLFLSLSSHGLDTPELQVSNGDLPLQQLTGTALKQALDDAGIQWRILVISACHAGAFIEPLKNPRTIIITAAAADKTSFGCADDRDLTYFGEAFYRDALPTATTLQAAFNTAKASIATRETQEQVTASDPQAYFGSEIAARLRY